MNEKTRISLKLTLGLTLAVIFDTVQQLAWKRGVGTAANNASSQLNIETILHEPLFAVVAVIMILRLINWLKVLELADLSFAQPITALSYVSVSITSAIFLHERLTLPHIAGVAMIVAGVWCISQTGFASRPSKATSA